MIILRYLNRELFHALLGITVVLLLIVVTNMFVHYLGVAATGSLTGGAVLKLMGLMLPRYMGILLPVSLFLAILLVYGRLFASKELLVMFACGLSWWRLLMITFLPASLVFICVGFLTLYVIPKMSVHQDRLTQNAAAGNNITLLKPGRFISLQGGSEVVYIGDVASDAQSVSNLFLFRQNEGQAPQIILAPGGHQAVNNKTQQNYVVLDQGHVYKSLTGGLDYQVIQFDSYATRIAVPVIQSVNLKLTSISTWGLVHEAGLDKSDALAREAELQWRLTLPIAVIILTILGVALCYVRPRQGRYAKLIPAILIFILYFNLVTISKSWIEQGTLSPMIGVWWVHGLFVLMGLGWLLIANGGGKVKNKF